MPDCVTHIYLAEDAVDPSNKMIDYNYFIIGSQGPDPLFYYQFQPWKKTRKVDRIAGIIHHEKTKAFLDTFIKKAKTGSKQIKGYVLGFLCHYALDSTAHPYIFHVTGNYSIKTKQYRGNHLRLERGIDSVLIKERGFNPIFYKVANHFPIKRLSTDFTNTFTSVMNEVYNLLDVGRLFSQSYIDFRNNFKYMVYDPTGIKKAVYSVVDVFTSGSLSYKQISNRTNIRNIDIMNRNHSLWKHPVTGEESNESFDELYQKALNLAKTLTQKTLNYFETGDEEIFTLTKNISYDTGLDCTKENKMIHINSIFN